MKYWSCGARCNPRAQGPANGSPSTYPKATVVIAKNAEMPHAARWKYLPRRKYWELKIM